MEAIKVFKNLIYFECPAYDLNKEILTILPKLSHLNLFLTTTYEDVYEEYINNTLTFIIKQKCSLERSNLVIYFQGVRLKKCDEF